MSLTASLKISGHEEFHVQLHSNSTAAEVLATVRYSLDANWRGNQLVSVGPNQLKPEDLVCEALDAGNPSLTVADFSRLGGPEICSISATELRGITLDQLESLLSFVQEMSPHWTENFGPQRGQPLCFEKFNLYHAAFWIIGPATAGHGGQGCSYVELVALEAADQKPRWFVSHAWIKPLPDFVACLKQHAKLRELKSTSPYWVCAYANNQHDLDEEQGRSKHVVSPKM